MENRIRVTFFDERSVSPTITLREGPGIDVIQWLEELKKQFDGRHIDAGCAAAQFAGLCYKRTAGKLNIGIRSNSLTPELARRAGFQSAHKPGATWYVVIDANNFLWRAYYDSSSDSEMEAEQ